MEEHPGEVPPAGDWRQEPKRCIGVADRSCGEEISRRWKRCPTCAAKQIQLKRPGHGLNYYRSGAEQETYRRYRRYRRELPVPAGDWRQRQRAASQPGKAPRADRVV